VSRRPLFEELHQSLLLMTRCRLASSPPDVGRATAGLVSRARASGRGGRDLLSPFLAEDDLPSDGLVGVGFLLG
jgi:hypothetical protein